MNLLVAMRYLVALDKHRHFGRAAQSCHITQPALSNALRSLESSFGVPILKRSRSYGGLTAEGEVVLDSARRMLREMELLEQDLHSANDAPRGELRLAAVPTAVPLLALFAAMLQRQHPGLRPGSTPSGSRRCWRMSARSPGKPNAPLPDCPSRLADGRGNEC